MKTKGDRNIDRGFEWQLALKILPSYNSGVTHVPRTSLKVGIVADSVMMVSRNFKEKEFEGTVMKRGYQTS